MDEKRDFWKHLEWARFVAKLLGEMFQTSGRACYLQTLLTTAPSTVGSVGVQLVGIVSWEFNVWTETSIGAAEATLFGYVHALPFPPRTALFFLSAPFRTQNNNFKWRM